MLLHKNTYRQLSDFAGYCRTGIPPAIPALNKEWAAYYPKLVLNVIDDSLQNAYPLTKELLSDQEWNDVVKTFFSNHACSSPQVWMMPKEFYEYLSKSNHPLLSKYPFLEDLLRFEWIELELFMMEDLLVKHTKLGDVLFSQLVLNPEHRLLHFQYPVHCKNAHQINGSDKGDYYVVAHRNKEGDILFNDLSPALVRMLEYLEEAPIAMKDVLGKFQTEYGLLLQQEEQENIIGFFAYALQEELIICFNN